LPAEQRRQFLGSIQTAMSGLTSREIEVLALNNTERGIDQASEHRFLGIWRFPNPQARDALLAGIKASGWWYDYFEHVNAAGESGGFASHLAALTAE
jgi:hypothetical protein